MTLLVLDNYDSFTYNLVHMFRSMNIDHEVYRNDKISPEEALSLIWLGLRLSLGVEGQLVIFLNDTLFILRVSQINII